MTRAPGMLLAALAAVLAMVIVIEIAAGIDTAEPARPARPAAGSSAQVTPRHDVASWVATALARPLFNPGRRPARMAPTTAAETSETPRLTGVMVGPFGKRAIFATGDDDKPVVVGEGETVGGYVVQAIEDGMVTVNGPDGLQTLHPSFTNGPPPLPVPGSSQGVGVNPVAPFPPVQPPSRPARTPR